MQVLAARIMDIQRREQQQGGGRAQEPDRLRRPFERIRTYNYPQGRITDHRINLTLYKLDYVMDGDLSKS